MRIAILGATGSVGSALIKKFQTTNHKITASFRKDHPKTGNKNINWVEIDLNDKNKIDTFLSGTDTLIYLIHSLNNPTFETIDINLAKKVGERAQKAKVKKIIYMGAINHKDEKLSKHLFVKKKTGETLASFLPTLEIRAGVILDNKNISYRMIERLSRFPIILGPEFLNNFCSPIFINDAVDSIIALVDKTPKINHEIFEIGAEKMRYSDLIGMCGKISHHFKNIIILVPFFPNSILAVLNHLLTSTPIHVSTALIESLKNNTDTTANRFKELTGKNPTPTIESLKKIARENNK